MNEKENNINVKDPVKQNRNNDRGNKIFSKSNNKNEKKKTDFNKINKVMDDEISSSIFSNQPLQINSNGRLRMVAISGAEEIGMNMTLYSYEKEDGSKFTILVDCGTTFVDFPGALIIMPDLPYLIEKGLRIDAIILTHGHEDHIGALPYLYDFVKVPMYATPFTCGLIEKKFHGIKKKDFILEKVNLGESRTIGPFNIKWIAVTHSIPDSAMLAIEVGEIRVLHTGDWKLDPDPVVGQVTDHASLIAFGKKGVHALVGDSTNIHEEESANSEGEVAASLKELVVKTKTGRFVLTCFASNVARIKSCIEAAKIGNRKVLILGSSLKKSVEVAEELGYLDTEGVIDEEESNLLRPEQLMIISTGSQGEENSALWKMAHKMRTAGSVLEKGDTIVFSARVIDGRQHGVRSIINLLVERGVRVLHPWNSQDSCIHASGHPARPDIAQLFDWVKPNCVIPVHSEAEHRISHIAFAKSKGYRAFNLRNGVVIEIKKDEIIKLDTLKHDKLVYDGNRLLPDHSEVFKQRKEIGENGILLITIGYKNKQQICNVSSYGVYDRTVDKNANDLSFLKKIKIDTERFVKKYSSQDLSQQETSIKREIVQLLRNSVWNSIKKNPQIICHIIG